jgi:hypothetical protein
MNIVRAISFSILFFVIHNSVHANEGATKVSSASKDSNGFLVHSVKSPYQKGATKIRVLLPDKMDGNKKYKVMFVLPVEAKDGNRYGNGLLEVKKLGLHNKHQLICVAPTFSHLPWYADHPTNKNIRQEMYFLKVVLPFVERSYPAIRKPKGRLLVGFSKSGWGAFTLLARNPQLFHKAAAWDAPFMKDKPNQFGMGPIFQTQENFTKYHLTALLKSKAKLLKKTNRFVLAGSGNFRRHHDQTHALMQALGIPHDYLVGSSKIKHHWNSGWLTEAVRLLVGPDG